MRFALGFLGLLGSAIACNGAGGGGDNSAPAGSASTPDAGSTARDAAPSSSAPLDPTDCVESETIGTMGASGGARWHLDADAREISLLRGDGTRLLGWRYDAAKLLVAYAGFRAREGGSQWDEFQHDRKYDAHGNETDFRASYPAFADLERPSSAPPTSRDHYDNVYDTNGALLSSTLTTFGMNGSVGSTSQIVFHENELQQCDRIETDGPVKSVEIRAYDAQGRLFRTDTTASGMVINCSSSTWTKIWTYDAQGRAIQLREWCDGAAPTSQPGRVTTTTYRVDGTQRVEVIDHITDLPGNYPQVTERSATCAAIDAWRAGAVGDTHPAGTRCTL